MIIFTLRFLQYQALIIQRITNYIVNDLTEMHICILGVISNLIIILHKKEKRFISKENCIIFSDNPRFEYAKILNYIIGMDKPNRYIFKDGYYVGENVHIGKGTIIEPYVLIGNKVEIGKDCTIRSGVKIRSNVIIKNNCILKRDCIVGDEAYGFESNEDRKHIRIHI